MTRNKNTPQVVGPEEAARSVQHRAWPNRGPVDTGTLPVWMQGAGKGLTEQEDPAHCAKVRRGRPLAHCHICIMTAPPQEVCQVLVPHSQVGRQRAEWSSALPRVGARSRLTPRPASYKHLTSRGLGPSLAETPVRSTSTAHSCWTLDAAIRTACWVNSGGRSCPQAKFAEEWPLMWSSNWRAWRHRAQQYTPWVMALQGKQLSTANIALTQFSSVLSSRK